MKKNQNKTFRINLSQQPFKQAKKSHDFERKVDFLEIRYSTTSK
jgi:hypothetical protein